MPLFSVIVPTFNSSATLGRALESILSQSYSELEIWIIDGQSKDETVAIIEEYKLKDDRINFICEPDNGIYDAMNKGIKLSKGEWLYFLGSDDRLYSNDVLLNVYHKIKETDAPVLYGNVKMNGSTAWAKNDEIYAGEFNLRKLLAQNICHQAIFYRRDIFKAIGLYNIGYKICADWDFNLRCYSKVKFYYIDEVIALYNGSGASSAASDLNFVNDKPYKLVKYFKYQLYRNEFVQFRSYFRKMIFQRNSLITFSDRMRIFLFVIILKLQSEK